MRNIFIANNFVANNPSAKGDLAIKNFEKFLDLTEIPPFQPNQYLTLINTLGNGSFKNFVLNPKNFTFSYAEEGSDSNDNFVITIPEGNVQTGGIPYVTGGIVIKKYDEAHNVWKDLALLNIESQSTLWSDIQTIIRNKLQTYGFGVSNTSSTVTTVYTTSSVFDDVRDNIILTFTGDISSISCKKNVGIKDLIRGEDVLRFEKELASNSGYIQDDEKGIKLYEDSNFIADISVNYRVISLRTKLEGEHDLFPSSEGFVKTLHIYVPVYEVPEGEVDIFTTLVNFFKAMLEKPNNTSDTYTPVAEGAA